MAAPGSPASYRRRAPTDPDVQISCIRLVEKQVCYVVLLVSSRSYLPY
jgi:hypothetical protein